MAETAEFNATDYLKQANERQEAAKSGKLPETPAKEPEKATPVIVAPVKDVDRKDDSEHRPSRSQRRTERRLVEEIGQLKGRLQAYEELGLTGRKPAAPINSDPEPQREQFATDSEYNRAAGRWDARQEAKKTVAEADKGTKAEREAEAFQAHIVAMDRKAVEDIKGIADWEEVAAAAADDDDAPEFPPAEHQEFVQMLAMSDIKARMLYHLAKNPKVFQGLLDLTGDFAAQLSAFKRLEGKVELLYTTEQKQEAAQASDKTKVESKDRNHPAEAQAGRNSLERDAQKARPSTEVAARGGTVAPEEPAIGSQAWMAKRNQIQYAR